MLPSLTADVDDTATNELAELETRPLHFLGGPTAARRSLVFT